MEAKCFINNNFGLLGKCKIFKWMMTIYFITIKLVNKYSCKNFKKMARNRKKYKI